MPLFGAKSEIQERADRGYNSLICYGLVNRRFNCSNFSTAYFTAKGLTRFEVGGGSARFCRTRLNIVEKPGGSGMAIAYKGEDTRSDRFGALKFTRRPWRRLFREREALGALNSRLSL
jgi:hypothetical protein